MCSKLDDFATFITILFSLYCTGLGYPFAIGINYWVVVGVFGICYLITTALMLVKWAIMDKTAPNSSILEED